MYRYHQHLMNDENWNRDLKKPARLPADASQEQTIHENTDHSQTINSPVDTVSKAGNPLTVDYHPENDIPETHPESNNNTDFTPRENSAHSKTINTPVASVSKAGTPLAVDYHPDNVIPETPPESNNNTDITPLENSTHSQTISSPVAAVSKARNPVAADYHPENVMPETTPPETKKDTLINAEQDEEKKMEELNNGKRDINQQMRWPVSKGAKKRKKGNHTWMFILTGFIISLVSGILMYTWIAQSKKNEFVSSLESFSVETAEASENDLYVYGNQEDTDFIADEFMDHDDNPEYVNEDAFNDPDMADLEDNMDVIEEPAMVSDNEAEFNSWDELDLTPVEENSAMAIKKPLEYPKEIEDVADNKKIVIKEKLQGNKDQKSEVMITKAAVREAPAVSLKKEKKEKIEQLAQLLASSDIAPYKKQIDLTDDVQSGTEKNVDKDKSHNKTVNAASDQGEQTPVTKKLPEKAGTHQVSVSKKLPEDDQKVHSASKQHINNPLKKEKNVTALHDKKQPLKAEIPALRVSDLDHHKPVKAILLANALPQRESVSSLNSQKGEQTGNTKKKEKTSIKAALAVKKANIQQQGQKHRRTVLLAQNEKAESKSSSPHYQPAKTVALREMAVTYVDQFNDHTNHWPEYNNDRAICSDRRRRIPHRKQGKIRFTYRSSPLWRFQ